MKIEKIDREALRQINLVALPALEIALAPFGITIEQGRCVYSNGSTGELRVKLIAAGADPDRENFELCAPLFKLLPSDYMRLFTVDGKRYSLVGIEPGRPKFPFIGRACADGKRFKFTEAAVLRAFEREPRA